MLITTANRPLASASQSTIARADSPAALASSISEAATERADQFTPSLTEPSEGSIKWGPVTALVGGFGAVSGLAGSGLGVISAVPAFVVGGLLGFGLVHEGVTKAIGNGRDSSGTGPIAAFAGLVGGIGFGIGAASLALSHGSPLAGLGTGVAAAGLSVGYGLYLNRG